MQLDFLIRRRGLDPAAETALHALRDLMHAPIVAAERGTLWRFECDATGDVPRLQHQLERAACRAGRYVNTNRDRCHWLEAQTRFGAHDVEGSTVSLWVTHGDGGDDVGRDYFENAVGSRLRSVRRGVFWALTTPEPDPQRARELVLDLAVTRTRRRGLLLNPHLEQLAVLSVIRNTKPAEAT